MFKSEGAGCSRAAVRRAGAALGARPFRPPDKANPGKSNRISKDEGIGYRGEERVLSFELGEREI